MQYLHNDKFKEIILIQPKIFYDDRGCFLETFQTKRYQDIGIKELFVQDNYSTSIKNTIRGMHYQLHYPQGKLVGVTSGRVFDVVVDVRLNSPTFGQWTSFELDAESYAQVYIPPGFAHGFCVLSDHASFYYKCTDYYRPEDDFGILWRDEQLSIPWPLDAQPILSAKDEKYLSLDQIPIHLLPKYISL